jgi:hypothetical protein
MSDPFWVFNFNKKYVQSAVALGAIVLFVGVPALAERSLPGDMLYTMKVEINEEIRSTLAFSPYAKVEWEAERLERRLSEARLLSQAGRLTEAVEQEVAEAVKKHSDNAQETIGEMRETDEENAVLAEIAFASVLEAQADILSLQGPVSVVGTDANEEVVATSIALAVADARTQTDAVDPLAVTPEKLFALIERDTTYAEELFNTISSDTSDEEKNDIDRRLADIARKVEVAQEKMNVLSAMGESAPVIDTETSVEATSTEELSIALTTTSENQREENIKELVSILRTALTDTRKLISFMSDIEIRNSVSVENLVPITLTEEERIQHVVKQLQEIAALQLEVRRYIVTDDLEERVTLGMTEAKQAATEAEVALSSKAVAEAEVLAGQALALMQDIKTLLQGSELMPVDELPIEDVTGTSTATTTPEVVEASQATTSESEV